MTEHEELPKGRRPEFTKETVNILADCIGVLCKCGFSPTQGDILDIVQEYAQANGITTRFKNGRPGYDWLKAFMKRNNLSMKKANMISSARKSATGNPFIIWDFYELLQKIVTENNLAAHQIWNCDESGFPHDPKNCRVVSVKGKTAFKVTCGAGRQNTTVLATCSASGEALAPLIIFQGKNLQSTWRGNKALKGTQYAVSDNGWITTEIFYDWFVKFTENIKDRPLLLIIDGHLTHVSPEVIKKAIDKNVTLLKFPPHITDVLHPLDVTCFGPIKRRWEAVLNKWCTTHGAKQSLSKPFFVDELAGIWKQCLSEKNVKAGFETTGIFSVDKNKYPRDRFDPRLLRRYDLWQDAGKPEDMMEELARSVMTPIKI